MSAITLIAGVGVIYGRLKSELSQVKAVLADIQKVVHATPCANSMVAGEKANLIVERLDGVTQDVVRVTRDVKRLGERTARLEAALEISTVSQRVPPTDPDEISG